MGQLPSDDAALQCVRSWLEFSPYGFFAVGMFAVRIFRRMDFSPHGIFVVRNFRCQNFSPFENFAVWIFCRMEFTPNGIFAAMLHLRDFMVFSSFLS